MAAVMTCVEAVEALADAGVRLTPAVADLRGGSADLAFTDALALTDEQETTLPVKLAAEIQQLADAVYARFPENSVAPIRAALARIQARAAMHAA